MQIDPFFQVPLHSHPTSRGAVELPVLLKEGDCVNALFLCQLDRVRQQLEGTGLEPALTLGQQTLVSLVMFDFVQTSIGPYRTLVLSVPVWRESGFRPRSPWRELFVAADHRHMGFYTLCAPSNTLASTTSGRELWGLPKTLSRIDFMLDGARMGCRVSNGVQPVAEFSGRGARIAPAPCLDFNLFSIHQNRLLRTLIHTRGQFHCHNPLGFRLTVGDVQHPLAQTLNALGLHGRRPVLLLGSTNFQGRMQEGVMVEQRENSGRIRASAAAAGW